MLSYVERGASLTSLSTQQLAEIERQFILYLMQITTFWRAVSACTAVLDDDQAHLRAVIKAKMADMIADVHCNAMFKPAILRLAAGDRTGFKRLGENPTRTLRVIAGSRMAFDDRINAVQYDIGSVGPKHLSSIEMVHLEKVKPHSTRFARTKARFLTMGEAGLELTDIVKDLQMLALRSLRWYYPFRSGLHLENTMRNTITNRGRSAIKYATADVRRRLVQGDDGVTYNRESSGLGYEIAIQSGYAQDPTDDLAIRSKLHSLARSGGTVADVVKFMLDHLLQEKFIDWVAKNDPRAAGSTDLTDVVSACGDYGGLIAGFLGCRPSDVRTALSDIQRHVA